MIQERYKMNINMVHKRQLLKLNNIYTGKLNIHIYFFVCPVFWMDPQLNLNIKYGNKALDAKV